MIFNPTKDFQNYELIETETNAASSEIVITSPLLPTAELQTEALSESLLEPLIQVPIAAPIAFSITTGNTSATEFANTIPTEIKPDTAAASATTANATTTVTTPTEVAEHINLPLAAENIAIVSSHSTEIVHPVVEPVDITLAPAEFVGMEEFTAITDLHTNKAGTSAADSVATLFTPTPKELIAQVAPIVVPVTDMPSGSVEIFGTIPAATVEATAPVTALDAALSTEITHASPTKIPPAVVDPAITVEAAVEVADTVPQKIASLLVAPFEASARVIDSVIAATELSPAKKEVAATKLFETLTAPAYPDSAAIIALAIDSVTTSTKVSMTTVEMAAEIAVTASDAVTPIPTIIPATAAVSTPVSAVITESVSTPVMVPPTPTENIAARIEAAASMVSQPAANPVQVFSLIDVSPATVEISAVGPPPIETNPIYVPKSVATDSVIASNELSWTSVKTPTTSMTFEKAAIICDKPPVPMVGHIATTIEIPTTPEKVTAALPEVITEAGPSAAVSATETLLVAQVTARREADTVTVPVATEETTASVAIVPAATKESAAVIAASVKRVAEAFDIPATPALVEAVTEPAAVNSVISAPNAAVAASNLEAICAQVADVTAVSNELSSPVVKVGTSVSTAKEQAAAIKIVSVAALPTKKVATVTIPITIENAATIPITVIVVTPVTESSTEKTCANVVGAAATSSEVPSTTEEVTAAVPAAAAEISSTVARAVSMEKPEEPCIELPTAGETIAVGRTHESMEINSDAPLSVIDKILDAISEKLKDQKRRNEEVINRLNELEKILTRLG